MSADGESLRDVIEQKTGGPAFPSPEMHSGMTLRQYFAAKAMQASIVAYAGKWEKGQAAEEVAKVAYAVADAMLKEGRA